MARLLAGEIKKDCKKCQQLRSPESFAAGAQVMIFEVQKDQCEECEVTRSQPIADNENIVDLYMALPLNYDGISGMRIVTASDIKFIFEIYEVEKSHWFDYYHRLIFLTEEIVKLIAKKNSAKSVVAVKDNVEK